MPSVQQMCRTAWQLARRMNASGSLHLLESTSTVASVKAGSAAVPFAPLLSTSQPTRGVTSLFPLASRGFHTGRPLAEERAALNPLQQTPDPTAATAGRDESSLTARAILRGVSISPQKLNDFVRMLRGLHIEDALIQCRIHPKKSAKICENVLKSAQANAVTNHGLKAENLKVFEAWVGRGRHLKRISIHGRGRSGKMYKYRSHLTIVLKEEATRKRTHIVTMLPERQKLWNMREGVPMLPPAPKDGQWWRRWPRKEATPSPIVP